MVPGAVAPGPGSPAGARDHEAGFRRDETANASGSSSLSKADDAKVELDGAAAEAAKPGPPAEVYAEVGYLEIAKQFSILGYMGFGGPAAHIGLFQKRLIEKLRWMPESVFMELFALGQCLPGPTSTQVSFALGCVKKGVPGGLLSGFLFQYPGAFIMTGLGIASAKVLKTPPDWLSAASSGVSAVGVALVASATKGLLMKLCATKLLAITGTVAAAAVIYWSSVPWLFPLLIALGGLVTIASNWKEDLSLKGDPPPVKVGMNMWWGGLLVLLWLGILIPVLVLVRVLDYDHRRDDTPLDWFEVFYRTGSIIYGGGQVVLPLLLGDLVIQDCSVTPCVDDTEQSWVTTEQFYAGLGLVQAMPGPLFNFAAYLGAIISYNAGYNPLVGSVICWFGLFTPGVVLMFAIMPFWTKFRKWNIYRRALPGMNAASVGLILASVFRMTLDVYRISPFPTAALCIGLFGFTAVDELKIFEPLVVVGGIVLGIIAWAAKMH